MRPGTEIRTTAVAIGGSMLVLATPSPAAAHITSYCGHGRDGYIWMTEFLHAHDSGDIHTHHYSHVYWNGSDLHDEHRICGGK